MCRTHFSFLPPVGHKEVAFFVELPARVIPGDAVVLWPLMPVEMAADPSHDWLQQEGAFLVVAACWSRDEWGIYLGVLLRPGPDQKEAAGGGAGMGNP